MYLFGEIETPLSLATTVAELAAPDDDPKANVAHVPAATRQARTLSAYLLRCKGTPFKG
jgi:hypothetical protein